MYVHLSFRKTLERCNYQNTRRTTEARAERALALPIETAIPTHENPDR
jgi:hypothetical protein